MRGDADVLIAFYPFSSAVGANMVSPMEQDMASYSCKETTSSTLSGYYNIKMVIITLRIWMTLV